MDKPRFINIVCMHVVTNDTVLQFATRLKNVAAMQIYL